MVSGAGGQRLTFRDGPTAPGRLPQVADGRGMRHRGSGRSGSAGAVHRSATTWKGQVGSVPPPDIADAGHPTG